MGVKTQLKKTILQDVAFKGQIYDHELHEFII